MGWTGGQYSLYRAALAAWVGAELIASASALSIPRDGGAIALRLAAYLLVGVLVVGLAAGLRDRLAARLLAPLVLLAELAGRPPSAMPDLLAAGIDAAAGRTALLPALLLLLHARVPAAPFGSLEARERTDPRGGWQRPAVQTELGWGLLVITLASGLIGELVVPGPASDAHDSPASRGSALAATGLALAFASLGLAAKHARPAAWTALALFGVACLAATSGMGGADGAAGARGAGSSGASGQALLLILACEPAWWRGRRGQRLAADLGARPAGSDRPLPARLFYDGDCGFCHRSVRFILSEELATPDALRLRFAPLGSDTFRACLARHPELDAASLPDSIVLELEDGLVLTRSAAALEIASRLGGFWRGLALAGRLVPRVLLDAGYDAIARVRKRLFARPKDACPILPPDLRARFDP